jgi:putative ABC transport system permease protein
MMLQLARRTIRRRLAAFVASFLALAFSALLVTVCGGLLETGLRGDVPPQRLLSAPILIAGSQSYYTEPLTERHRLDASLAGAVAAVPGVGHTVKDVSFPVTPLRGRQPAIEGHGWSSAQLTPFRLVEGRAPQAAGDVVLDQGLARRLDVRVGADVPVLSSGMSLSLRVVGIAAASTDQAPTLFVTDARAASLLGQPGRTDAVAVYPAGSTATGTLADRISAALRGRGVTVLTGVMRGRAEFPDAAGENTDLVPLAAASGGLMTAVAVFIVASTLALSVQSRRRQIALLRAVGATPGQLRRLLLSETFLLAVPAVAVGLLPTEAIGRRLLRAFADHGLVAERLVYHQSFIPTLSGAAVAVLTGLVAALVASRAAIRVRPVEALAADATPQRWLSRPRLVFGVLTFAGALALTLVTALVFDGPVAASTAEPSAMLWAVSLALLAPAVTRPVLAPLGRLAAVLAPRAGHLAMLNIRGRGALTAAVITPVMLATGLATALLYVQSSQQAATEHAYAQHLSADLVVSSASGLPLGSAARVAALPGVAAASPLVTSMGFFDVPPGSHPDDVATIPLEGLDATAAGLVTDYQVTAGSLSRLDGDTVAISSDSADARRGVGDTVTVRFGDDAAARLRIVAVFTGRRGYPMMLLPAGLLAAHTTTGLAGQVLVATKAHADTAAVARALRAVAPGVSVTDRSATLSSFAAQQQTGAWVSYMFIVALVIFTTVSLINTTVTATVQRRPQLRMLRLVGANRGQLARTMTIEALLVSAAGVVLGTAVMLATLLPFDSALGTPGLPAGPFWIYLAIIGAAGLLTVLVTRLATRLLRTDLAHI